MVAVIGVIRGKCDPAVTKRNQMLDSFGAGCSRLVVGKCQARMVEPVAQHDGRKSLIADKAGDIAVGRSRAEDGASNAFSKEELRVRFFRDFYRVARCVIFRS